MKKKKFIYLLLLASIILAGCSQKKLSNSKSNSKRTIQKSNDIDEKIKKMSLDQKIGQLYFAHSTGNFEQMFHDIQKYQLGGITLFAPDYQRKSKKQFQNEMQLYRQKSQHGLLISTDQEGGTVSRLSKTKLANGRKFPSPQVIYQKGGLKQIKQENIEVAQLLRQNGINMNFAPVADVSSKSSSFIYDRTLGENYQKTAEYISVAVKAIQSQNVAAVLKHFPGYGDAKDTHNGFAEVNKKLTDYEKEDLLPFKAGINCDVDGIMVSHIIIKSLDNKRPASLSPRVHQLLRNQLHYHGLIITDDLQMGAITEYGRVSHNNVDVLALKAGNDILLGGDYQTGIPEIKKAIKNGQISEKQIDESVKKIFKLKQQLKILK
ncbi:glycoside hydrolase family 3 protein [Lactobacillus sp. PSON]|uniref:glycoside hydrolase family 3 protein n=1 Tax=Lactobacillus sp. PSON TaxID=3455454 RepID=UPI0040424C2C